MDSRKDRLTMADALNKVLAMIRGEGGGHPLYGQRDPGVMAHGGFASGQGQMPHRMPYYEPNGPMTDRDFDGPMTDRDMPQWSRRMSGGQIGQMEQDGPMTDADFATPAPPRRHPGYDYEAIERFAEPAYREGPHQNIDDDMRLRALASVAGLSRG